MREFTYKIPTEIVFGENTESKTGRLVKKYGGSRVLIVYGGGSVVRSGLLDRVSASLAEAGVEYRLFGGVQPNPTLSKAEEGVREAVAMQADMILAVGGGSAIDTAKGIAHGASMPEVPLWDIWTLKVPMGKSLPVGVVLTIPAAGSETSADAVLTNEAIKRKQGLNGEQNRPVFAVMNPALASTLPRWHIACGVADIMMHTIDRIFNPLTGNDVSDELAEAVLRMTVKHGKAAWENPGDYQAMSELMWCSSLSHNGLTGLGGTRGFSVHACGHELSAEFDLTHGASMAVAFSAMSRYVYKADPARYARYARNVWGVSGGSEEEQALEGIRRTVDYFRSLELPVCAHDFLHRAFTEQEIEDMTQRCSVRGTKILRNVMDLQLEDVRKIFTLMNEKI